MIESELLSTKNIFSKCYTKTWLREISVIDSVTKTKPWAYKIKYLNEEAIIGNFNEKEMLPSKLQMSYYLELDSHIRDNVKVVLDSGA